MGPLIAGYVILGSTVFVLATLPDENLKMIGFVRCLSLPHFFHERARCKNCESLFISKAKLPDISTLQANYAATSIRQLTDPENGSFFIPNPSPVASIDTLSSLI